MRFLAVFAVTFVLFGWQSVHALVLNCEGDGIYSELRINRDQGTAKFGTHGAGKYTTVGDYWFWVTSKKAAKGSMMFSTSFMFNTRSQKITVGIVFSDQPKTKGFPQSLVTEWRCARPLN